MLKIRLYALVVYIYSVLGCLTVSDCVEGRHIIAGNSRPPPAPTARTTDMMASVPATNNQHIIQDNWRTVLSSHYHILTSPHSTSWDWIFKKILLILYDPPSISVTESFFCILFWYLNKTAWICIITSCL